ncbi:MAG: hypothetical protein H6983_05515 [Ectothiorhodospiraceae bacterium]|nr:hypothetical protein [Chromatiales bacterium]MCP5153600.1 hypothetical protein [Ectothiorhodospiraceae bacterium]
MRESTVSRFFRRVGDDAALAEEYRAAVRGAIRAAVWPAITEVAARHGHAFSLEELEQWLDEREAELSDEALTGIVGGAARPPAAAVARIPGIGAWWPPAAVGAVVIGAITGASDDDGDDREPISP